MNMHPHGSGSLDDALSNGAAKGPHVTLLNQLQNKSSQSLFLVVHKILDDIIKNRKEDDTVAFLKELVQIIEQRSLQQAEHLSKFKTREEKYQAKIRAFTTLVTGVMEENKAEKTIAEEKKRLEDVELVRLRKENEECNLEISKLNQELEMTRDKQERNSKAFEDDFLLLSQNMRNIEEENKILRQRTQMYHDQNEKEAQKTMVEEKKRLEEENKILRERTQMYHEQYEKEMDFLEKFSLPESISRFYGGTEKQTREATTGRIQDS